MINAGVSSATSFEETFYIKHTLINLKPDLIIVYDGFNDAQYRRITEPEIDDKDESKEFKFKNFPFYRTERKYGTTIFSIFVHTLKENKSCSKQK